jgi:hypothetical protein
MKTVLASDVFGALGGILSRNVKRRSRYVTMLFLT